MTTMLIRYIFPRLKSLFHPYNSMASRMNEEHVSRVTRSAIKRKLGSIVQEKTASSKDVGSKESDKPKTQRKHNKSSDVKIELKGKTVQYFYPFYMYKVVCSYMCVFLPVTTPIKSEILIFLFSQF